MYKLKEASKLLGMEIEQFRDYARLLEKHGYTVHKLDNGHRLYTKQNLEDIGTMVNYAEIGIPLYTTAKHLTGVVDVDTEIIDVLTDPEKKAVRLKDAADCVGVTMQLFQECIASLEMDGELHHRVVSGVNVYSKEDVEMVRNMCSNGEEDETYPLHEASIKSGVVVHIFRKYINLMEEQGYAVERAENGEKVYKNKDIKAVKLVKEYNKNGVMLFDAVQKVIGA
ncbi:hypothetical protein [Bacillus mycoides]|uniref:hypothetical protein n=1 Tax=Bacillus mycoides TaxID=1405 RepID=UPI003A811311